MSPAAELRHVSIEVHDMARAGPFYDAFLGRLGFQRFVHEPGYRGYSGGKLSVWVIHGSPSRVHRPPPTGEEEVVADHLAFWVPSKGEVEAVQTDLARREVYPIVRCAERPEFQPGYFSAIWVDPDGEVLEVYTTGKPPKKRTRGKRVKSPAQKKPKAKRRRRQT